VSRAEVSRARVQQLIAKGEVLVNQTAAKASLRLRVTSKSRLLGRRTLHRCAPFPEEIALDIVYEDDDLAIVNKPAGMMVHAGAGATDDARNRGTLVNALLHHFGTLFRSRRRVASGDRASSRPGDQRADGGGEER